MTRPQHKYSVILNNYQRPSDRFMAGGYATEPDTRTTVDLIELAGRQGLAQGLELIAIDGPSGIGIGSFNQREVRAALDANGLALAGVMPNLWGHAWQQYGTLGAADASTRRRSIDLCKRAMDIAAAGNCEYVGLWPGHDGADYYFEADYQRMWEWWVEGVASWPTTTPRSALAWNRNPRSRAPFR